MPTAVLSGRDVGLLAGTGTGRFNLESCDTALLINYTPHHPLYHHITQPPLLLQSLCLIQTSVVLTRFLQLTRPHFSPPPQSFQELLMQAEQSPGLESEGMVIIKTALLLWSWPISPLLFLRCCQPPPTLPPQERAMWPHWVEIMPAERLAEAIGVCFGEDLVVLLKLYGFLPVWCPDQGPLLLSGSFRRRTSNKHSHHQVL